MNETNQDYINPAILDDFEEWSYSDLDMSEDIAAILG